MNSTQSWLCKISQIKFRSFWPAGHVKFSLFGIKFLSIEEMLFCWCTFNWVHPTAQQTSWPIYILATFGFSRCYCLLWFCSSYFCNLAFFWVLTLCQHLKWYGWFALTYLTFYPSPEQHHSSYLDFESFYPRFCIEQESSSAWKQTCWNLGNAAKHVLTACSIKSNKINSYKKCNHSDQSFL